MNRRLMLNAKTLHRNLWFKALVALGLLLGVVLLVQTMATYRYVSRSMIVHAAERQISQKAVALRISLRSLPSADPAALSNLAGGLRQESSGQIAWVRILDADGKQLAGSGTSVGTSFTPAQIQQSLRDHQPLEKIVTTPAGEVLVAVHRLGRERPAQPEGASGRTVPAPRLVVEMAVYLRTVAAPFQRLRASSIIGCSAALALLIAMIAIGLTFNRYLQGKQLARELELARRVQADLLPSVESAPRQLDFTGCCIPAWQVGGDFYDVFEVDPGQLALVLGDIAGKGMPAALLSGLVQGVVRAVSWMLRSGGLERAVQELNELLCLRTADDRFASLFWCQYEPETLSLRYVNAGHLPPMIVRRDPDGRFQVERLEAGGPVLGLLPHVSYRGGQTWASAGDLLVMFSDGITEAANANGDDFGEQGLLKTVCDNWDCEPRRICDVVFEQLRLFLGDNPPQDDQSLVIVRLKPIPSDSAPEGSSLVASSARTPEQ